MGLCGRRLCTCWRRLLLIRLLAPVNQAALAELAATVHARDWLVAAESVRFRSTSRTVADVLAVAVRVAGVALIIAISVCLIRVGGCRTVVVHVRHIILVVVHASRKAGQRVLAAAGSRLTLDAFVTVRIAVLRVAVGVIPVDRSVPVVIAGVGAAVPGLGVTNLLADEVHLGVDQRYQCIAWAEILLVENLFARRGACALEFIHVGTAEGGPDEKNDQQSTAAHHVPLLVQTHFRVTQASTVSAACQG